ncbi:MAG TPA: DNA ligase D [Xanthobacteraceae bacterium]|nr:DNA ligase D [Xanthobacteraceae bacterium]
MALDLYRKKRKFGVTAEPRGRKGGRGGNRYVIQKHAARRLHYDLRLELDGVMKSWAVTRGPSLDPGEKRLAVHVEDHPIEYNSFEGTIPQGEYGGGTVMIWDRGRWIPEGDPHKGYAKGHLDFLLEGKKLHGRWHLVRMRGRDRDRHENWLLIKGRDDEARSGRGGDVLEQQPLSVASGRSMDEIAAGKGKKRVWHSNRSANRSANRSTAKARPQTQREFRAELQAQSRSRLKTSGGPKVSAKSTAKRNKPTAKRKSTAKAATPVAARRSADPVRPNRRRGGLPDFVPPSLATLHSAPPDGAGWIHEIKFDGYRIEARLDHGKVRLLTRKQLDWTHRFERIATAVAALPAQTALLDGELVVENENGISSFSLLQTDLKDGRENRFVYWIFDLLHLDGQDFTNEPLTARKAALRRLLRGQPRNGPLRYTEDFEERGSAIFTHACELGLEGIVSKLRDAPYHSGRSENFIKTKCHNAQEFVVVGFTPSTAMPNAVGALTVAFYDNGKLRYAGRVGTGYTHQKARDLWKRLSALCTDRPRLDLPKDERRKNVIWVKPELVIETEFRGITHDGLLRQASYKGLREDKPANEVVRERPAEQAMPAKQRVTRKSADRKPVQREAKRPPSSAPARASSGGGHVEVADVHLTHPDRVYWADVGVTKEALAAYYVDVWKLMAPHLVDRPLAIVRCPDGIAGECFFQKHIASNIKESPLRHVVESKEHDVIAVEKLSDLIELAQFGALEIHVRGSRLGRLELCDRIVFDLDPDESVSWKEIVAAAQETRDRLKALKLQSFAKLSGGKGIHVVVPVTGADWDSTKRFTARMAAAMAADSPQRYLAKMTKSLRKGKIFIDYFRNSREATSVAVYSTRARAGAPISMPVTWAALPRTTAGNQFTLLNSKKHLKNDPWAEIGKIKQKLPD